MLVLLCLIQDPWELRACMPSWMGASTPLPPCAVSRCSLCMPAILRPTDMEPGLKEVFHAESQHLPELRAASMQTRWEGQG